MDKEVLIHVRGLHMMEEDGEQEPVEIVVPGEYYFRNGSHYLRYEEILEDFSEPTINYIKISPKGIEVRKKGIVNVHMVFEQGKKNNHKRKIKTDCLPDYHIRLQSVFCYFHITVFYNVKFLQFFG